MVEADIVAIASGLLRHANEEVREQAALLISSFSTHALAQP